MPCCLHAGCHAWALGAWQVHVVAPTFHDQRQNVAIPDVARASKARSLWQREFLGLASLRACMAVPAKVRRRSTRCCRNNTLQERCLQTPASAPSALPLRLGPATSNSACPWSLSSRTLHGATPSQLSVAKKQQLMASARVQGSSQEDLQLFGCCCHQRCLSSCGMTCEISQATALSLTAQCTLQQPALPHSDNDGLRRKPQLLA